MSEAGTVGVCPGCGAETDPYSNICEHCRYVHMGRLVRVASPADEGDVPHPLPGGPQDPYASGMACPFCCTHSTRIGTEGYSQDRGVPPREARELGLWRTRTVGVCDHCGETWGLASKGVPTPCPSCGSNDSGRFGYGVQRNCWECGSVWRSPPPPKPVTRMDRLGEAITLTAALGMFLFFGVIGLFWLGLGIAALIIAPILLVPLGLVALVVALFYLTSRPKRKARDADEFGWLAGLPADGGDVTAESDRKARARAGAADYRPERPECHRD